MTKQVRLFNLDLHISVIKDFQHIIKSIFNDQVEVTNLSLSGHNWVFNQSTAIVEHINQNTWRNINLESIIHFQEKYDTYLSQFDGFVVTHTPVFSMLYEKYNKPIIIINSCRYEQPFCWTRDLPMWEELNNSLKRINASGNLIAVSNNKADQEYFLSSTGIQNIHIPSLCLYTNSSYTPEKHSFINYNNNNNIPTNIMIERRPNNGYTWSHLYKYMGIIHSPYEISTMSLFEQYSAGVPVFLPTKRFLKECINNGQMNLISIYNNGIVPDSIRETLGDSVTNIDFWIDRADYYDSENFKYIYHYDSIQDLTTQLAEFNDIYYNDRLIWLNQRKDKIFKTWENIIINKFKLEKEPA